MALKSRYDRPVWLASGLRTPFAKVDSALASYDAIALSVPVVQHMLASLPDGGRPDFAAWGTVVPNLTWSNIAREVLMDAGAPATIPAFSTVMACSTSMIGMIEAAGMLDDDSLQLALVGGVDSLSRIQLGLNQRLSDWIRRFQKARSLGEKVSHALSLKAGDIKLYIPGIVNRTSGLSMGEHTEITAKDWHMRREDEDAWALGSHQRAVAGWESGFFDDLVIPVGDFRRDSIPRADTSLEKLAKLPPSFDRTSGQGTLTAGNSSPLTDGAASLWVATQRGLDRLPSQVPRVKLIDWEIAAVDFRTEGLLMAPAYAIPRLLARHGLGYQDIGLWEIHEAFAAQVLAHIAALQSHDFLTRKAGVDREFGAFPHNALNPNGG